MIKSKSQNIRQIKPIIKEVVEQKLCEMLGDPDEGLELKQSVKRKLEISLKSHNKGTPAKKTADELGLRW